MYYRSHSPASYSDLRGRSNFSRGLDLGITSLTPRNRSVQRVINSGLSSRRDRSRSPGRDFSSHIASSRPLPSVLSSDISPILRRKDIGLSSHDSLGATTGWRASNDYSYSKPQTYYDLPISTSRYTSYSSTIKKPHRTDYNDFLWPALQSRTLLKPNYVPRSRTERESVATPLVRERKLIKFREMTNDILTGVRRKISWDLPEEIDSPLINEMKKNEGISDNVCERIMSRESSLSRRGSRGSVSNTPESRSPTVLSRRSSDQSIDRVSPRSLLRLKSPRNSTASTDFSSESNDLQSIPIPPPRKKSLGSTQRIKNSRKPSIENIDERSLNNSIIADQIIRSRQNRFDASKTLEEASSFPEPVSAPSDTVDVEIKSTQSTTGDLPVRRRRPDPSIASTDQEQANERSRGRARRKLEQSSLGSPDNPLISNHMHRKSVKYKINDSPHRHLSKTSDESVAKNQFSSKTAEPSKSDANGNDSFNNNQILAEDLSKSVNKNNSTENDKSVEKYPPVDKLTEKALKCNLELKKLPSDLNTVPQKIEKEKLNENYKSVTKLNKEIDTAPMLCIETSNLTDNLSKNQNSDSKRTSKTAKTFATENNLDSKKIFLDKTIAEKVKPISIISPSNTTLNSKGIKDKELNGFNTENTVAPNSNHINQQNFEIKSINLPNYSAKPNTTEKVSFSVNDKILEDSKLCSKTLNSKNVISENKSIDCKTVKDKLTQNCISINNASILTDTPANSRNISNEEKFTPSENVAGSNVLEKSNFVDINIKNSEKLKTIEDNKESNQVFGNKSTIHSGTIHSIQTLNSLSNDVSKKETKNSGKDLEKIVSKDKAVKLPEKKEKLANHSNLKEKHLKNQMSEKNSPLNQDPSKSSETLNVSSKLVTKDSKLIDIKSPKINDPVLDGSSVNFENSVKPNLQSISSKNSNSTTSPKIGKDETIKIKKEIIDPNLNSSLDSNQLTSTDINSDKLNTLKHKKGNDASLNQIQNKIKNKDQEEIVVICKLPQPKYKSNESVSSQRKEAIVKTISTYIESTTSNEKTVNTSESYSQQSNIPKKPIATVHSNAIFNKSESSDDTKALDILKSPDLGLEVNVTHVVVLKPKNQNSKTLQTETNNGSGRASNHLKAIPDLVQSTIKVKNESNKKDETKTIIDTNKSSKPLLDINSNKILRKNIPSELIGGNDETEPKNINKIPDLLTTNNDLKLETNEQKEIISKEKFQVLKNKETKSDNLISEKKISDSLISEKKISDNLISGKKVSDNLISEKTISKEKFQVLKNKETKSDNLISEKKISDNLISEKKVSDNLISEKTVSKEKFQALKNKETKSDNLISEKKISDLEYNTVKTKVGDLKSDKSAISEPLNDLELSKSKTVIPKTTDSESKQLKTEEIKISDIESDKLKVLETKVDNLKFSKLTTKKDALEPGKLNKKIGGLNSDKLEAESITDLNANKLKSLETKTNALKSNKLQAVEPNISNVEVIKSKTNLTTSNLESSEVKSKIDDLDLGKSKAVAQKNDLDSTKFKLLEPKTNELKSSKSKTEVLKTSDIETNKSKTKEISSDLESSKLKSVSPKVLDLDTVKAKEKSNSLESSKLKNVQSKINDSELSKSKQVDPDVGFEDSSKLDPADKKIGELDCNRSKTVNSIPLKASEKMVNDLDSSQSKNSKTKPSELESCKLKTEVPKPSVVEINKSKTTEITNDIESSKSKSVDAKTCDLESKKSKTESSSLASDKSKITEAKTSDLESKSVETKIRDVESSKSAEGEIKDGKLESNKPKCVDLIPLKPSDKKDECKEISDESSRGKSKLNTDKHSVCRSKTSENLSSTVEEETKTTGVKEKGVAKRYRKSSTVPNVKLELQVSEEVVSKQAIIPVENETNKNKIKSNSENIISQSNLKGSKDADRNIAKLPEPKKLPIEDRKSDIPLADDKPKVVKFQDINCDSNENVKKRDVKIEEHDIQFNKSGNAEVISKHVPEGILKVDTSSKPDNLSSLRHGLEEKKTDKAEQTSIGINGNACDTENIKKSISIANKCDKVPPEKEKQTAATVPKTANETKKTEKSAKLVDKGVKSPVHKQKKTVDLPPMSPRPTRYGLVIGRPVNLYPSSSSEDDSDSWDSSSSISSLSEENDSLCEDNLDNECNITCHQKCEKFVPNLCGVNQKLLSDVLDRVKKDKGSEKRAFSRSGERSREKTPLTSSVSNATIITNFSTISFDDSPPKNSSSPKKLCFRKYTINDFAFLKLLGTGSFGKVLLAELKDHDMFFAVKCLRKDTVLEDDDVESAMIERRVLALGTQHPYLCKLYCTFQTESYLFFVMEYLNGGDLMFHIQNGQFEESRAMFYGAEIVSALKFLHKRGIVYRDIKLDNILFDENGHVHLVDFGMCKSGMLDPYAKTSTFCGTPDYIPPEIILGQRYNQSVDWWSFGVLLFEMILGRSPFVGTDEDELFWSICNEEPSYPHFISKQARDILQKLLVRTPSDRLGMPSSPYGDIKEHSFFSPIDWEKLEKKEIPPPFKPTVISASDTRNFDRSFTMNSPSLSPVDSTILQSMDQEQFDGFSYTNPNIVG